MLIFDIWYIYIYIYVIYSILRWKNFERKFKFSRSIHVDSFDFVRLQRICFDFKSTAAFYWQCKYRCVFCFAKEVFFFFLSQLFDFVIIIAVATFAVYLKCSANLNGERNVRFWNFCVCVCVRVLRVQCASCRWWILPFAHCFPSIVLRQRKNKSKSKSKLNSTQLSFRFFTFIFIFPLPFPHFHTFHSSKQTLKYIHKQTLAAYY